MARKAGLGKGLDGLIPQKIDNKKTIGNNDEKRSPDAAVMVDIRKVEPNRDQPRKVFEKEALDELSESIGKFGVLQPLLVQKRDGFYEIIAGERRWRAARQAGLSEIPVIIKEYTEQEMVEISLIENIQREDLNPIEEAIAYKRLLEEFDLKQEEVAERVSKSRAAVANSIRLLKLPQKVQDLLIEDELSMGHARALLSLEDEELQGKTAKKIMDNKLSVRETEKLVKKLNEGDKKEPAGTKKDSQMEAVYRDMEEKLKNLFGTKVSIKGSDDGKGKIEISYYSADEFDRLIGLITQEEGRMR